MASHQKPHAVMIPFPVQGHIIPLMRLAKLLHTKGFHITFVHTEFNHKRLIRSSEGFGEEESVKGLDDFRFETIPDGLATSENEKDATQDGIQLVDSIRKNCLVPFKDLLAKLINSTSLPPVSCVIADGIAGFAIKAAKDLGIPDAQFWTASTSSLIGFLHFQQLINRKIVPFPNAGYLSDPHKGRSQTGYVFTCGGTAISWRSQKQTLVATSSNHAEVIALHEASRECMWPKSMTEHIRTTSGFQPINDPITLYEDNAACVVQMKEGFVKSDRTKHIPPKLFSFTQELEKNNVTNIQYVRSCENSADLLTKALPTSVFRKHVHDIGMRKLQNL